MRILLVHNKYLQKGGEDAVLLTEAEMLRAHSNEVRIMEFDNEGTKSFIGKALVGLNGIYNSSSANRLKKEIDSFKPDVIHVHNLFYTASPSILYAAKAKGIPVVMTLHNYRLVCPAATLLRDGHVCELCVSQTIPFSGIFNRCFHNSFTESAHLGLIVGLHKLLNTWGDKVSQYIVLTDFIRNRMIDSSLKLDPNQVVVKPNFVTDRGDFSAKPRNGHFLFVGRLSQEKGIKTLLDAFKQADFPLDIIGSGPLAAEVEACAATHPNLTYYGRRDAEFVAERMAECEALVFPSVWYEGMPLTILESFASGTPVIASDIDNVNLIVEKDYNGRHFKFGNAEDMAQVLTRFLNSPEENKALYKNARKSFQEKYSENTNYKRLHAIYMNAIGNMRQPEISFDLKLKTDTSD